MGIAGSPGVWVMSGPGLPCGARHTDVMGPAPRGKAWLDVCIIGQHLPQMYREAEIRPLRADECPALGLCPDCLGFGDLSRRPLAVAELARGVDQVREPCGNCGGTGRPALRVTIARGAGGVTGSIRPLPHAYVPPLPGADPEMAALFQMPDGMCLACGMPPDGTGPRGEALHQ